MNTPETDAAWYSFTGNTEFAHNVQNLSRKLERERDEAIEKHRFAVIHWQIGVAKMERERDEARTERDILRIDAKREAEHHDKMVGELEKVYKERDEVREMAEEADAAHDMAIADLASCEKSVDTLVQRAEELIGRWDSPTWKEVGPTARFIEKLREAVAAYEGHSRSEAPKKPCPLPPIDERYMVVKKAPRTKRRRVR
jgi:hypothetical protein